MKPDLKPYQREDVDWLHSIGGRALIASDQGTGKTAISCTYIDEADLYPALIVCPASVKGNWKKELQLWADREATIISGETTPDIDPATIQAAIVNYDILKHQAPFLTQIPYKVIVFDECHTLSNRAATWTKESTLLSRRTKRVLALSGTPIQNRPADFWPVLHILKPKEFPSFLPYAWKYCEPKKTYWGYDYNGSSNLEDLHEKIKPFTVRRLKSEVLTLPKRTTHMVRLEMDNAAEYQEASQDFLGYLGRRGHMERLEKAKKAEAITRINALLMLSARLKAKSAVKWCRDYLAQHPDKKMIVFAVNDLMIDVLHRRVAPGQSVMINGKVPSGKRTAIIEQFQTDPNIRVLVGNVQAAGVGITLTAARVTVFAQLPWKPSAVSQAQDRAYRIGQDEETEQYYLVVPDSIEEKLCTLIQQKQNVADLVIEGKASGAMDLLTLLHESMKK